MNVRIWDIQEVWLESFLLKIAGSEKKEAVLQGKLKKTKDGFIYLDVSNDVINGLFRLIEDEKVKQPPYRNDKYNNVGAHISVFLKDETKEFELDNIEEIGSWFSFNIKGVFSLVPDGWKGVKKVWIVEVNSPELESLRRKYGLPPKIKGHEFHITIGIKK